MPSYQSRYKEAVILKDNDGKWSMLISDIYSHYGSNVFSEQIINRMNMINEIFTTEYIDDTFCDICPIMIKRYFDMNDKSTAFNDFIPSLNYKTRGLYFVPINVRYSNILYIQLFKLKAIIFI